MAERYRDALVVVRSKVAQRVAAAWDRLGSWDKADVARFTAVVVPTVEAGQRRAQALTDIYLARTLGVGPVGLSDLTGAAVRNGTDPAVVYERPFVQLWSALSEGVGFERARAAAGARAAGSAQTDVQLTVRAATSEWLSDPPADAPRIIGYERTLTDESCALCAVASTQRYKTEDLMPIHERCDCGVAPILEGERPAGRVINRPLLDRLKEQDVDPSRHVKVDTDGNVQLPETAVHEHGELGPQLTEAAHDFTGPSGIPDAA